MVQEGTDLLVKDYAFLRNTTRSSTQRKKSPHTLVLNIHVQEQQSSQRGTAEAASRKGLGWAQEDTINAEGAVGE